LLFYDNVVNKDFQNKFITFNFMTTISSVEKMHRARSLSRLYLPGGLTNDEQPTEDNCSVVVDTKLSTIFSLPL